jgi:hypothetical protein
VKYEALVELSQERSTLKGIFDDVGFETRNVGDAVLIRKIVVIPAYPACAGENGPKSGECRRYPDVVLVKFGKTIIKKYWIPYRASLYGMTKVVYDALISKIWPLPFSALQ